MAVVCKTWSLTGEMANTGLCTMEMRPETATRTTNCTICVTPGTCVSGCDWLWDGDEWIINRNCCPEGTSPVPPASDGESVDEIQSGTCE